MPYERVQPLLNLDSSSGHNDLFLDLTGPHTRERNCPHFRNGLSW